MKAVSVGKLFLPILLLSAGVLPAFASGCNSSLFSAEGQVRFGQFVLTCAVFYLCLLFVKTSLFTWYHHRFGFWRISLRSLAGTVLSVVLGGIICLYCYLNLMVFFRDPVLSICLLLFFLSLSATLSDSIFALNWKKLGYMQIGLSLFFNLVLNCSALIAIYLSFFASARSFFD